MLSTLEPGEHLFTLTAVDYAGNTATKSVTFKVVVSIHSLKWSLHQYYAEGEIDSRSVYHSLLAKLEYAEHSHKRSQVVYALTSFIERVQQQSGKHISVEAADQLIEDARWLLDNMP